MAQGLERELLIGDREKILERFEHHDRRTQAAPDAAELQTDDAGADHHSCFGTEVNSSASHESMM